MAHPLPRLVEPGSFEPDRHFYPRVLNAQIHPVARTFMSMGVDRLVRRYCHLNPQVDAGRLTTLLRSEARWFRWAGADLMFVTDAEGRRQMVVIETNSCPSGQKSMPLLDEDQEQGGYRRLLDRSFRALLKAKRPPEGPLAVIYDKNEMEASGYAATMADLTQREVWLAPFYDNDPDPTVRFTDGVLQIRAPGAGWTNVRGAFRYVTQRPWNRIPLHTKTAILNPVVACLAGGRNKMVASKAYDMYNGGLAGSGLQIRTPETIWDVSQAEVPLWVARLGGHAVVKVPYSNAGQGVFTITGAAELDAFMEQEFPYDQFIVQSLIGNYRWSSTGQAGRLFHVGTVPDRKLRTFVSDLRVMVGNHGNGFFPLAVYARRARAPLPETLAPGTDSWNVLGTNLSVKDSSGTWSTQTERLLLMDRKDMNHMGLSVDALIEAYVQTVLSALAIDQMSASLMSSKGRFRTRLFKSLNDDQALLDELTM